MTPPPMLTFGGDASVKAGLLARIGPAASSENGEGQGAISALSEALDQPKLFADRYGMPAGLVALMTLLGQWKANSPGGSDALHRAWIAATPVGVDLSSVPTRVVLWMLADESVGTEPGGIGARIVDLHKREGNGEAVARQEWSGIRADALALADAPEDRNLRERIHLRLWEGAAWPARSSRSILTDMTGPWVDLSAAVDDPAWSEADELRKEATLKGLWDEHADAREAGEEVDYPALFRAIDPDLEARFVANLNKVIAERGKRIERLFNECLACLTDPGRP